MKSFNREQAISNLNRIIEMKDRKYSNFKSENIVLEDFSYSYINKHPMVKNLSLEIESGQKIWIIGRTGTGKSFHTKNWLKMWFNVDLNCEASLIIT